MNFLDDKIGTLQQLDTSRVIGALAIMLCFPGCDTPGGDDLGDDPWRAIEPGAGSPGALLIDPTSFSSSAAASPTWSRTGGAGANDIIWDMDITPDGNFVVAVGEDGSNNPASVIQGLVLVLNAADGSTHCTQTVGGQGIEYFQGLALDGGSIYAAGGRAQGGHDEPYVAKLSLLDCSVQWARRYKFTQSSLKPEVALDIAVDGPGGNLMVVGAGSLDTVQTSGVPFTVELSPAGTVLRNPSFPIPPVSIITRVEKADLSSTDRRWSLFGGSASGPGVLQIDAGTLQPVPGTGRTLTSPGNRLVADAAPNRFTDEFMTVDGDILSSLSSTLATAGQFSIPAVTTLPFFVHGVDTNALGVVCTGGAFQPNGQPTVGTMLSFLATPAPTLIGGVPLPQGSGNTAFGAAAAGPDGCYVGGMTTAAGGDTDWYIAKTPFIP